MMVSAAFKIRTRFNETYKTLRRRIAAKFRMHHIGSLIKLNQFSEELMLGRFFENWTYLSECFINTRFFKQTIMETENLLPIKSNRVLKN